MVLFAKEKLAVIRPCRGLQITASSLGTKFCPAFRLRRERHVGQPNFVFLRSILGAQTHASNTMALPASWRQRRRVEPGSDEAAGP